MILQTQDVAAGILYDDRSKDVLPQKASLRKHSMQPFLIKIYSQIGWWYTCSYYMGVELWGDFYTVIGFWFYIDTLSVVDDN